MNKEAINKLSMYPHKLLQDLLELTKVVPSGSYHICNPPVTNTDIDFFVYDKLSVTQYLLDNGFNSTSDDTYDITFSTYRKGNINVILVHPVILNRVHLATKVAKELNIKNKQHRIILFQAILYNKYEDKIEL